MRKFIWKLRYALRIRKLVGLSWGRAWDNATAQMENLGDEWRIWSPTTCAEWERDEWHRLDDTVATWKRLEYEDTTDKQRAERYLNEWSKCEKELRGYKLAMLGENMTPEQTIAFYEAHEDECFELAKQLARVVVDGERPEVNALRMMRLLDPVYHDRRLLNWLDAHQASIEVTEPDPLTCRVQASDDYRAEGFSNPYDVRKAIEAARKIA